MTRAGTSVGASVSRYLTIHCRMSRLVEQVFMMFLVYKLQLLKVIDVMGTVCAE